MKKFLLLSISLLLLSCNDEDYQSSEQQSTDLVADNFTSLQGRLYFKSKEDFVKIYNSKKDDPLKYQSKFNDLYSKNEFISLTPSYSTEEDLSLYSSKIQNKSLQSKTNSSPVYDENILDNIDDLEDYFGEEAFSNFLNQDAELIIADQLYKYTDAGLFIVDFDSKENLYQYLDEKNINPDLLTNSESTIQNYIVSNNLQKGMTTLNSESGLSLYMPAMSETGSTCGEDITQECDGPGPGDIDYGGQYPGGGNSGSGNDDLIAASSNLPLCNPSKGLLGSIMGNIKICIDKYSNDRRVKTKYYDVDLLLVYATGVKVKHQKRGWTGIWSRTDADKVALGINSISWEFKPDFSYGRPSSVRMYISDGRMYESYQSFLNVIYQKHIPMPNLPFHKGRTVQALIEFSINNNIATEYELQKYFYEKIYNTVNDAFKSASNKNLENFTIVGSTPGGTWIQYYNLDKVCENCSRKEDVIDWGFATPEVTYSFGTGSNSGFSVSSWNFNFRRAKLINLKSYGMVKVNNTWKGHRLEF